VRAKAAPIPLFGQRDEETMPGKQINICPDDNFAQKSVNEPKSEKQRSNNGHPSGPPHRRCPYFHFDFDFIMKSQSGCLAGWPLTTCPKWTPILAGFRGNMARSVRYCPPGPASFFIRLVSRLVTGSRGRQRMTQTIQLFVFNNIPIFECCSLSPTC